jgi:hypothetical protein
VTGTAASVGPRHQLPEPVGAGLLGDAQIDLVIQFLEGAAGDKKDMLGVDRRGERVPAARLEVGQLDLYVLVFHQGEQAVLGDDALDAGLATNRGADLVHLVHADDAVRDILAHGVNVGTLAEDAGGLARQAVHHDIRLPAAARQVGDQVGIDADDGRVFLEFAGRGVKTLDRPHDGCLARARVADHEHVADAVPDQVLVDGNGHAPQGLVLANDIPGQLGEDLRRGNRCFTGHGVLVFRQLQGDIAMQYYQPMKPARHAQWDTGRQPRRSARARVTQGGTP